MTSSSSRIPVELPLQLEKKYKYVGKNWRWICTGFEPYHSWQTECWFGDKLGTLKPGAVVTVLGQPVIPNPFHTRRIQMEIKTNQRPYRSGFVVFRSSDWQLVKKIEEDNEPATP